MRGLVEMEEGGEVEDGGRGGERALVLQIVHILADDADIVRSGLADSGVGLRLANGEKDDPVLDVEQTAVVIVEARIGRVELLEDGGHIQLVFDDAVHEADQMRHMTTPTKHLQHEAEQLATDHHGALALHGDVFGDAFQNGLVALHRRVFRVDEGLHVFAAEIDVEVGCGQHGVVGGEADEGLEEEERRSAHLGVAVVEEEEEVARRRVVEDVLLQLVALVAELRQQDAAQTSQFPVVRFQVVLHQQGNAVLLALGARQIVLVTSDHQQIQHATQIIRRGHGVRVARQEGHQEDEQVLHVVLVHVEVERRDAGPQPQQRRPVVLLRFERDALQRREVDRVQHGDHRVRRPLREVRQ